MLRWILIVGVCQSSFGGTYFNFTNPDYHHNPGLEGQDRKHDVMQKGTPLLVDDHRIKSRKNAQVQKTGFFRGLFRKPLKSEERKKIFSPKRFFDKGFRKGSKSGVPGANEKKGSITGRHLETVSETLEKGKKDGGNFQACSNSREDIEEVHQNQDNLGLLERKGLFKKNPLDLELLRFNHGFNNTDELSSKRLYIFISLSLHKQTLRALLREAKRVGGVLVLRGLKENSWQKTIELMLPILEESQNGIILDPTLFKRFKIDRVPTIVLTNDDSTNGESSSIESSDMTDQSAATFDKIAGNITIHHALRLFRDKGDLSAAADKILRRVS